jgi:hypothetical protein
MIYYLERYRRKSPQIIHCSKIFGGLLLCRMTTIGRTHVKYSTRSFLQCIETFLPVHPSALQCIFILASYVYVFNFDCVSCASSNIIICIYIISTVHVIIAATIKYGQNQNQIFLYREVTFLYVNRTLNFSYML